jgi:hypothetical protein
MIAALMKDVDVNAPIVVKTNSNLGVLIDVKAQ